MCVEGLRLSNGDDDTGASVRHANWRGERLEAAGGGLVCCVHAFFMGLDCGLFDGIKLFK